MAWVYGLESLGSYEVGMALLHNFTRIVEKGGIIHEFYNIPGD